MNGIRKEVVVLFAVLLLAGCAVQRYKPAPIVPGLTASQFESRDLADPGLSAFAQTILGHPLSPWPPKAWDLQTLSLAAWYFNPALNSVRARIAATDAAQVTAGARPNPSLNISPGIPSPYLLTLDFAFPIETAHKRMHRLQVARRLGDAARFDLADTAWTISSAVRTALLNHLLATRSVQLFRSEAKIRQDQIGILDQIVSAGESSRQSADAARIELARTHGAIVAVEGQVADTRAALSAAIGVPVAALQSLNFSWPDLDTPPGAESLLPAEIQRQAILNRLDLRRSLAQYAAAEAALQLEIAKQYPDLTIGPGYTYEETHSFFTLGLSTVIPLFNRNQGPIAEAEAHRQEAAALFLERQAQVISRSARALAVYTAALKELDESDSLSRLQEAQSQILQQAISAGTDTRLSLDNAEIQNWTLARARMDALARAQKALGELADALQRPLDPGGLFTITPESPSLLGPSKNLKR